MSETVGHRVASCVLILAYVGTFIVVRRMP